MFSQHLAKPRGPGNCLEVIYPLCGLLGGAVHLPRITAAVPSLFFAALICCEEALKHSPSPLRAPSLPCLSRLSLSLGCKIKIIYYPPTTTETIMPFKHL